MQIEITDPLGISGYSEPIGYFVTINSKNEVAQMKTCREYFAQQWAKVGFHRLIGFKRVSVKPNAAPTTYLNPQLCKENGINFESLKAGINIELMKKFWNDVFSKLGDEWKFEIHTCNLPDIIIIDVPEIWNKNDTVRSVLTLLLRCSIIHYSEGDTITSAMMKYNLGKLAIAPIEWFLAGNTVPMYSGWTRNTRFGDYGFVAEFDGLSQDQIESKLTKPMRIVSKY
jgi:hypothetical protein